MWMKIKKVGEKLKLLLGGSKKKNYIHSLNEKENKKKGGWKLKLVFGSFRK